MSWPIEEFYVLQQKDPRSTRWDLIVKSYNKEDLRGQYINNIRRSTHIDVRIAKVFTFKDDNGDIQMRPIEILEFRRGEDD